MKVSLNWLREYVEFTGDAEALVKLLTFAGVEVEGVEQRGVVLAKVVVTQIKSSEPHPNADRLSVCRVDDGSMELRQIVCGAKNYRVGDKVPLALPGALLPGDFAIKVGKLRGVESQGMLCSAKELRVAEDAEGLLILPASARVGAPIDELFPTDSVLDIEITPNRGDLASHLGIAREVAALSGLPLPRVQLKTPNGQPDELGEFSVEVEAPVECPFYSLRLIRNITVGPSPDWLRQRLESIGLRAINNIVDITNYVMYETGEPLHAFDADRIARGIRVRLASAGEQFLALDGRTYTLGLGDLVIADAERAVALAGVMGGEESGVTEATRNVLIESAYFRPANIRRTARTLGLASDSSYRFERGVDPEGVLPASQRAVDLICEIAGGEAGGLATAGNPPVLTGEVDFRYARCNMVLGTRLGAAVMDETLTRFGLEKRAGRSDASIWSVPSFRRDLTREIDLIEEIARVHGIDEVESRYVGRFAPVSDVDREYDFEMALRRNLVAQGFAEARTSRLISERALVDSPFDSHEAPRVRNPFSEEHVALRPSLVPELISVVARNVRMGNHDLRIFELGRVFGVEGREEERRLALVMTGAVAPRSWRAREPRRIDLHDMRGALEALGLPGLELGFVSNDRLALCVEIRAGGNLLGHAGQLWPARARELDLRSPVFIAEMSLVALERTIIRAPRFCELDKFPAVTRDIAFIASLNLTHAQVGEILAKVNEPLLVDVQLFDVFTDPSGEKLGGEKKSLGYSLTYRAKNRTLTINEVSAAHDRLKGALQTELDIQFRE